MENKQKDGFSYTYSAKEQSEIRKIREKYTRTDAPEDKMSRLRRLDASVTQKAQTIALIFGVVGVLILGMGMSLCMTDVGATLGIAQGLIMPLGIVIGIVGCVPISLAYPIYTRILRRERKRIAPEILRLSEELLK